MTSSIPSQASRQVSTFPPGQSRPVGFLFDLSFSFPPPPFLPPPPWPLPSALPPDLNTPAPGKASCRSAEPRPRLSQEHIPGGEPVYLRLIISSVYSNSIISIFLDLKLGSNSPEICADVEMGARLGVAMVARAWARTPRQVFVDLRLVVWGDDNDWGRERR